MTDVSTIQILRLLTKLHLLQKDGWFTFKVQPELKKYEKFCLKCWKSSKSVRCVVTPTICDVISGFVKRQSG